MFIHKVCYFIILSVSIILTGCAGVKPNPNPVAAAHESTLLLTMTNGICSGTAVGPHTILTAEHCMTGEKSLSINNDPVEVDKVIIDHRDHALVIVSATFNHWAVISRRPPVQGEDVFIIGNPAELRDVYNRGYVSGFRIVDGMTAVLYQLPIYFGDSGSAIWSKDCEIVGVVSGMHREPDKTYYYGVTVSYTLGFTPKQLTEIQ